MRDTNRTRIRSTVFPAAVMRCLLTAIVAVACLSVYGAAQPSARHMLFGRELRDRAGANDTAGWDRVAARYGLHAGFAARDPVRACALFAAVGKSVIAVPASSAVSAALLREQGFDLLALTRWYYESVPDMKPGAFGTRHEPDACPLVSKLLWEPVTTTDVIDPSYMNADYTVRVTFDDGGTSEYPGAAGIKDAFVKINGADDVWIDADHFAKRKIVALFLIGPGDADDGAIVERIGRTMDSLRLGVNYKTPELKRIACAAADTGRMARLKTQPPVSVAAASSHVDSTKIVQDSTVQRVTAAVLDTTPGKKDSSASIARENPVRSADSVDTISGVNSEDTSAADSATTAVPDNPVAPTATEKPLMTHACLSRIQDCRSLSISGAGLYVAGVMLSYGIVTPLLYARIADADKSTATLFDFLSGFTAATKLAGASISCLAAKEASTAFAPYGGSSSKSSTVWWYYLAGSACAVAGTVCTSIASKTYDKTLATTATVLDIGQDVCWTAAIMQSTAVTMGIFHKAGEMKLSLRPLTTATGESGLALDVKF